MLTIIAGKWKRRRLEIPSAEITRPTSQRCREAIFNMLEHTYGIFWEEQKVLDAFAGSGGFGFECLSRGALFCHFYEIHKQAAQVIKHNKQLLGIAEQTTTFQQDILSAQAPTAPYTLIFIDPPYDQGLEDALLTKLKNETGWINQDTLVVLERRSKTKAKKESEGFHKLQTRQYGEAEVLFLKLT